MFIKFRVMFHNQLWSLLINDLLVSFKGEGELLTYNTKADFTVFQQQWTSDNIGTLCTVA
jgi:hypothetical protein